VKCTPSIGNFLGQVKGGPVTDGAQVEMFDVVELLVDLPEHRLRVGARGAIVHWYPGDTYEVDCSGEEGEALALVPLSARQFAVVWRANARSSVPRGEGVTGGRGRIGAQVRNASTGMMSGVQGDYWGFQNLLGTKGPLTVQVEEVLDLLGYVGGHELMPKIATFPHGDVSDDQNVPVVPIQVFDSPCGRGTATNGTEAGICGHHVLLFGPLRRIRS